MCIAGNTAMEHLLLGLDVSSLGRAPFVPVEKGLQQSSQNHFADKSAQLLPLPVNSRLYPCQHIRTIFPLGIHFAISIRHSPRLRIPGEGALRAGGKGASEHNGGTPFRGNGGAAGRLAYGGRRGIFRYAGLRCALHERFCPRDDTSNPSSRCSIAVFPAIHIQRIFPAFPFSFTLYALGLFAAKASEVREKSKKARHAALLIDLGTNGEMAITDGQRMVVCRLRISFCLK